jgi:hypothetical protein
MSDGLGVVIAILVMVSIAVQLWHIWPDGEEEEDVDASNPVGFAAYDPAEHEDDDEPWECRKRPRGPHMSDASWAKLQREDKGE